MSKGQAPSHPGVELARILAERGMTQREFAVRLGVSLKHVNEICNGHSTYSPHLAVMMERVLGKPSAGYWLDLLSEYRLARAKAQQAS